MSGEDIPCAAGVRGDGPCSFELCPPGIGCRRVREQRQQGEGGAVLGEEALALAQQALRLYCEDLAPLAAEAVVRILDGGPIAVLVAQARAEERERIASRFDSVDGDGLGRLAPVVTGLFEQVARIVRGTS